MCSFILADISVSQIFFPQKKKKKWCLYPFQKSHIGWALAIKPQGYHYNRADFIILSKTLGRNYSGNQLGAVLDENDQNEI